MAIFKLKISGEDISKGELVEASPTDLQLEEYLENWLERSPWVLGEEPFLTFLRIRPRSPILLASIL